MYNLLAVVALAIHNNGGLVLACRKESEAKTNFPINKIIFALSQKNTILTPQRVKQYVQRSTNIYDTE